jgi:hypothetical protein
MKSLYRQLFDLAFTPMYAGSPVTMMSQLDQYSVVKQGQYEVIRQTLYDFQTYAQAGQTQLSFFQVPVGQSSKTKADTNMQLAGQLPFPQKFVAQSIEVAFFPGVNPGAAAAAPATVEIFVNDVWTVMKSGWLRFLVGQKDYVVEAPIGRFPTKACRLDGWSSQSDTTTAGATQLNRLSYATFGGRPYPVSPWVKLDTSINFSVELNWPAAVALNAGDTTARIGVILDGLLVRAAQ